MPVGFNSPARNLFLLGSSGAQVVTNFFKTIYQSAGIDGVYDPAEIKYNSVDQKFVLAGSAEDSNSKGFGWFEKRDDAGTADWDVRVEAGVGINTTLRAMELDSNDNLIVVGKTADIPWIAKYSNGGVIDWQSTTNTGDVEYTGITSDANGNYYACGNTPVAGEAQAFVEKFDASGNPGWGKSAFMLGRDVVLNRIAANSRGEVVAVGYLEDDIYNKGYIVKIDTNTGEVLWDRTLIPDWQGDNLNCSDVYIDSNDQIYVTVNGTFVGYLIKYTAEGNMIWQKTTDNPSTTITFDQVKSDGETEQTIVFGTYDDGTDVGGILSKYSKDGKLVWRRTLFSSYKNSDTFASVCLDADPSFYYLLYIDDAVSGLNGTPEAYTFGKVSSSGNGLGDFQYAEGTGETIDYEILSVTDKIGRLSDGSVRNDTSDLITYPFNANKLLFDDLATQVSNKKRQMDSADSFEYSGSPAIRPADFVTKEYTTDGYGVPPQKNYIGLSETLQPTSTNGTGTTNNTWSRQTTNVTVTANVIASPIGVGSMAEKYNISATSGRRLEYGVPSGVFVAGQTYTYSMWMKAITTNAEWNFQAYSAGNSNNSIRIADKDGNILENISTTNSTTYKPKDTEWHRVVWSFTADNTTGSPVGGYNGNSQTGDLWYLWGAQLVDGPNPLKYYRNYTNTPENAAGTEHAPSITAGATYSFDQTETLQIGEIPGDFSQMTVEIWFKSSTFSNWQNPIDCNYATQDVDGNGAANSGNVGPRLEINASGQIGWYWGSSLAANDPKSSSVITTISTNTWYHSVLSISGAGMGDAEFFLNGSSVGVNNSAGGGSWIGIIRNLVLGRGFAIGGRPFNGDIGEVRIYPRALTAAQVFQNYNATKSKYTNEAPDTAPKISDSAIVYDSNLLLNYDFGNKATFDPKDTSFTKITPPTAGNGANFGYHTRQLSNGFVTGEPWNNNGVVYWYDNNGNNIATIADPTNDGSWGYYVYSDRVDRVLINMPYYNDGTTRGFLYVYDGSGNLLSTIPRPEYNPGVNHPTWNGITEVAAIGEGKIAVIDAYFYDPGTTNERGALWIMDEDGTNQIRVLSPEVTPGSGTFNDFNYNVFIDNGYVYVYTSIYGIAGNTWTVVDFNGNIIRDFLPTEDGAEPNDFGYPAGAGEGLFLLGSDGGTVGIPAKTFIYDSTDNFNLVGTIDNTVTGNPYGGDYGTQTFHVYNGHIYISYDTNNYVRRFDLNGNFEKQINGPEYFNLTRLANGRSSDGFGYNNLVDLGGESYAIPAPYDNNDDGSIYLLKPTTVKNLSSSSYTGTITGPVFETGYFDFDGTNDYIDLGSINWIGGNTFSIEFWINFDVLAANTYYTVVSFGGYVPGGMLLQRKGDGVNSWRFAFNGNITYDTPTAFTTTGAWTHVVATVSSTPQNVYVNNASQSFSGSGSPVLTNPQNFEIGRRTDTTNQYIDGKIGEFRVYSRVLTATEVSQNFNATRGKYGV